MKPSIKLKKLSNLIKLKVVNVLLKLSDLNFVEAKNREELENACRIRYQIYLDEGYVDPNPLNSLEDQYDVFSKNFLIYKNRKIIGAFRLTIDSKEGFSFENFANFEKPAIARSKIGEVSKLCVKKEYRGGRFIMLGVIKTVYKSMQELKLDYLYIGTQERLAKKIGSYGVVLKELKEYEPTAENLEHRKLLKGYFAKIKPKHYLVDIRESIEKILLRF